MPSEPVIAQIMAQYDLAHPQMTHLGTVWNTTYRVVVENGASYNLRVCNPLFQDRRCLQDELAFLDFVAQRRQVRIPRPVPNRHQEWVTAIATPEGERLSCLFTWIEGQAARGRLSPAVLHRMGQSVAFLHEASQSYAFPFDGDGFRETYRYDEQLALSHRQWIKERADEIGSKQVAVLQQAIEYVLAAFTQVGKQRDTYGFIHADLHSGNFIVQDEQVSVIDFDQLGRGHFGYDIAVLLIDLLDEPAEFDTRWHSFKSGYQTAGGLPFPDRQRLEPFVIAVELAFLDWYYNCAPPSVRTQSMRQVRAVYEFIRGYLERSESNG